MHYLLSFSLFLFAFLGSFPPVHGQIAADFYFELSGSAEKMMAPVKVDFINASEGEQLSYNWTIDGTSFTTSEEASRLFLKGGKYKICLEVSKEGLKDQQCQYLEFFDPTALPVLAQSSKR